MSAYTSTLIQLSYLIASSCFILGLRYLNSPLTARRGNFLASLGMLIAIVVTLLDRAVLNYETVFVGIILGSLVGFFAARLVKMTAMPQMVGLFNGFGGAASALVAIAEYVRLSGASQEIPLETLIIIFSGLLVGAVTFSGSLVAFGKLQGWVKGSPLTFPLQQPLNILIVLSLLSGCVYLSLEGANFPLFVGLICVSTLLGVLFVIAIGGADMPVVVSLLNSFSGVAASIAGFLIMNNVLIISGALVGASGLILTQIMCKAMNRPLSNVLFGAFGTGDLEAGSLAAGVGDKTVRSIGAEEGAMILAYARSVIIVPGYGMAAAQAQHNVKALSDHLEKRGVDVKYAIHPVAGRMPGHMNVLLAEADVPYTQLVDMDDINPEFERTDIVLVIGANDVVNPAARHEKTSPIYGMPILDVDKAQNIIVIKRSLNPGFAGIENELFYNKKTMMLFGNAKEAVAQLSTEVSQL